MERHVPRRLEAAGLFVLTLLPMSAAGQAPSSIDEGVDWGQPLVLQETDQALSVRPRLGLAPAGFIVADQPESQVRVYGDDGLLVSAFGREGEGPGEFRAMSVATRLDDGRYVALDRDGRMSLWTRDGALVADFRTGLRGGLSAGPLGDGRIVVVTGPMVTSLDELEAPLVHIFDLEERRVVAHLLSLPLTRETTATAMSVSGAVAPLTGSRFGVTWTTFDSLWVVDMSRPVVAESIALDSELLAANGPPVDRMQDRAGFTEWMLETVFPLEAYALPDGGWLVNLSRLRGGPDGQWLLRVDREGHRIWEVSTPSRLVAVDPESGELFFADPTGLAPNEFRRGRLK